MEPSIDNQYIKTPKLDTIYLHVTRRCSLNCAYCYLDADISSDDIITWEQSHKVFADAVLLNCRRMVFTGGEPLMHPELFRMAEELSRVDKVHKILRCISTNGMYIDEGNAKKIVDLFDDIRVSIDGTEDINDALRGHGSYKASIRAMEYLKSAGGNPTAAVTVTSRNVNKLKDLMGFLLFDMGITNIHLGLFKPQGRGIANSESLLCSRAEMEEAAREFWESIFGNIQMEEEKVKEQNCGVGRYLNIYPDGSVYPCHILSSKEFCLGNISEKSIYKIYMENTLIHKLSALDFCDLAARYDGFAEYGACLGQLCNDDKIKDYILHMA